MSGYKKNIIWLASYPKSGNTWVRIFLNNILYPGEEKIDTESLEGIPIASNRFLIDRYLGVASSDLSEQEVFDLRPEVYRAISEESGNIRVLKVHDAFGSTSKGEPLFPPEVTHSVIYVIRNPLDIAVSYAFHSNRTFDDTIRWMNDPGYTISKNNEKLKAQVSQFLGSWSDHVHSWIDQDTHPVFILRYEDLIRNAAAAFSDMLNATKLGHDNDLFRIALEKSDFRYLQSAEKTFGFREKPIHAALFFREGKSGTYSENLSDEQIRTVIEVHRDVMKKFGYLKNSED